MPELFPQQLKANFTPEQQDYYLQLKREEQEILNGQTIEELVAKNEPQILEKLVAIRQRMLSFVLTKKTREMVKQEEEGKDDRLWKQREEQLEIERQAVDLDDIKRKHNAGEELADNEIKFLYKIDGFGKPFNLMDEEKRIIDNIIEERDIKKDVARVLNCDESHISLTEDEWLSGFDIQYHYGGLDLEHVRTVEDLELPRRIGGYLDLGSLRSIKGLKLPESMGGALILGGLRTTEGAEIPRGIKKVILKDVSDEGAYKLVKKFPYTEFIRV